MKKIFLLAFFCQQAFATSVCDFTSPDYNKIDCANYHLDQISLSDNNTSYMSQDQVGLPWALKHNGESFVEGILQFRGNPTHTWYGKGPVPLKPQRLWRYPEEPMCSVSRSGGKSKRWCGTGWTGQPIVWERPDGITEVIFGAYDRKVHFVNIETGKQTREPFETGDIIKGTVSLDPDGFPLLYFGSRDNYFRILSLQNPKRAVELFKINGQTKDRIWNDDWDANASVVGDILFEGGENSWFHAYKLNRGYDSEGNVTVNPKLIIRYKGWTSDLIKKIGDRNVSIENSAVVYEDRVYFANSGGRIVGLDISGINEDDYEPEVVFDFWAGDDIDASLVVDEEGFLYASVESERRRSKSLKRQCEVGQVVKLNPYSDNPLEWKVELIKDGCKSSKRSDYGIWATPAIYKEYLYVPTHRGKLLTIDRANGEVTSSLNVGYHAWSSPLVVDDELILGSCANKPGVRFFNLDDPSQPVELSHKNIQTSGCVESTPSLWKGKIVFGSRDGYFYGHGDR